MDDVRQLAVDLSAQKKAQQAESATFFLAAHQIMYGPRLFAFGHSLLLLHSSGYHLFSHA